MATLIAEALEAALVNGLDSPLLAPYRRGKSNPSAWGQVSTKKPKPMKAVLTRNPDSAFSMPNLAMDNSERAARERRLKKFNGELAAVSNIALATREGQRAQFYGHDLPVTMGNEKLAVTRRVHDTYLQGEHYDAMPGNFRRLVDVGAQTLSSPRFIRRPTKGDEAVLVTSNGTATVHGSYRNRDGSPLTADFKGKKMHKREYARYRKGLRKAVDQMAAVAAAPVIAREQAAAYADANEKSATDYRRYFR